MTDSDVDVDRKNDLPFISVKINVTYYCYSVADPDPWNPYHFPGSRSGSVSKNGWIRNPDPDLYQMIRIRIQPKPLKT